MEKRTAVFVKSVTYGKDPVFVAAVKLEVNYIGRTFSITPIRGDNSFKFINSSHDYEMWKAVLIAIDQCIDFGNKELGITE